MSYAIENALEKKEVAKTILSQINRMELMAIGAKNYVSLSSASFGGLQFDASLFGRKQTRVVICLDGNDLYNVAVYKKTAKGLTRFASAQDVYAENLTDFVVSLVEKRFAE